ncbi:PSP1 C-terminal conserved region [Flavobacterium micromati]|uniref:PSP1 C-terminal conserved region n=1 Tax=Flavobacterium micromati TaxID=229205 RepID=A0A1M5JGA2_9FLAO|nr:regulatory iron-sulfur-containing complex subunit RicT [Flavobacterium micromati]SHG39604.1 PSP1 C-terminal conserved region [Flavobacterium micromati]
MENYSTEGSFVPSKTTSTDSNYTYGRSQSDVFNWLSNIIIPGDDKVYNIIEIKFKGSRKEFYLNDQNIDLKNGELVVVEGNIGGYDIGQVSLTGELVHLQLRKKKVHKEDIFKKIHRKATPYDANKWKVAKESELPTMLKARSIARELGISMKLTDVDYQGDKSKATFYYTAEGRVDFRELIKHLSEAFHIRIEMRQIGSREEANRIGDIGPCGSYMCCQTWSTNFKTDSPWVSLHKKNSLYKRQGDKFECYIIDESEDNQQLKSDACSDESHTRKKSAVPKPLSYVNVVGQDSITRFDNKESELKKNNLKNKKRKPL